MGADLYITKDPVEATGYFRDSYNESNVLWRYGLSYWGLAEQIPDIGKIHRTLTLKQVKILRLEIQNRQHIFDKFMLDVNEEWLKAHNCEAGVAGWVNFWKEKSVKLIAFLDHAIELKSGIRWSV